MSPLILPYMNHFSYLIDDNETSQIPIDELHKYLQEGGCLVHCFLGISRSSAFVIAYLMKYYNMSLNEAYDFVKKLRPSINPNPGFMKILSNFEETLNSL